MPWWIANTIFDFTRRGPGLPDEGHMLGSKTSAVTASGQHPQG
jgi:hypothetical protein